MPPHSLHSNDCVVIRETYRITAGVFAILVLQNYRQESKDRWYSWHIFPHLIHPLLWFPAVDWVKVGLRFCFFALQDLWWKSLKTVGYNSIWKLCFRNFDMVLFFADSSGNWTLISLFLLWDVLDFQLGKKSAGCFHLFWWVCFCQVLA